MADGNAISKASVKDRGQAAHTDGNATVVATITLPNVEGYYIVVGRAGGGSATATNKFYTRVEGTVYVNASAVSAAAVAEDQNTGGSGYVGSFTYSGLEVRLNVTAANGVYSTGFIECLDGVELAITPA